MSVYAFLNEHVQFFVNEVQVDNARVQLVHDQLNKSWRIDLAITPEELARLQGAGPQRHWAQGDS